MSFLSDFGEVGQIGLKQLKETRQVVTQRWEKLGLLEGLQGHVKENCAQLFENQLSDMMSKERIDESSQSQSSGQFETVAFPVIRRIFAKLLANDIVSVQALNLPIGKLFFINPKVSSRQTNGQHYAPDGAYQNAATTNVNSRTQYDSTSLYDAFYATSANDEGTSLFDRSKGTITVVTGNTQQVIPYTQGTASIQVVLSGFTTANDGILVGPAGMPIDSEAFLASLKIYSNVNFKAPSAFSGYNTTSGSTLQYHVKVQSYGKSIVDANGKLYVVVDLTYPGMNGYSALTASTTPVKFYYSYNNYSNLEEDSQMAEVTFTLDQVTVSVTSRKMRAQWTPELAQDVAAFHNIDAEAELTALLSEQMAAEIDREILRDLRRGAAWTLRWDYNGLNNRSVAFMGTQKDWNQTLITKVNQISAQIHKSTLRGGASWIVVSAEVSAVLNDIEYFHVSNASAEQDKYNLGIEKVGVINGNIQVYRDPYSPANTVLIGHKGTSILEAGYIYAPYIPLQLTPVLYNPFDMTPIRGIMTRYAKKMVLNRYFGRIYCDGLQVFATNGNVDGLLN